MCRQAANCGTSVIRIANFWEFTLVGISKYALAIMAKLISNSRVMAGNEARASSRVNPFSAATRVDTHSAKLLAVSACADVAVTAMSAAVIRFFILLVFVWVD